MFAWLKPLLQMFYAPARALGAVRDRAPLGGAAVLALLAQVALTVYALWPFLVRTFARAGALGAFGLLRDAAGTLFLLALAFIPALVLFANWFERRGSLRLVLQQEYAPLASAIYYAWAAANFAALPLVWLARRGGLEAQVIEQTRQRLELLAVQQNVPQNVLLLWTDPQQLTGSFAFVLVVPFFLLWALVAVRVVFRVSGLRALAVVVGSGFAFFLASPILSFVGPLLASPFLLMIVGFFLWGYLTEVRRTQRARANFRQNLEAATQNPADASAHYNLALIHLQRKELTEARQRFQRAIEIDAEEVDAHYQLGRISRMEQKLPEAIGHFGEVVTRAPQHAQHEVWREIGATYLSAAQFDDALDALERYLEHRPSDPEALYLKGRALAGTGRTREAAEAMRACIESVQTAPAYKYRADKRWLNEAQQFLRTQA